MIVPLPEVMFVPHLSVSNEKIICLTFVSFLCDLMLFDAIFFCTMYVPKRGTIARTDINVIAKPLPVPLASDLNTTVMNLSVLLTLAGIVFPQNLPRDYKRMC